MEDDGSLTSICIGSWDYTTFNERNGNCSCANV